MTGGNAMSLHTHTDPKPTAQAPVKPARSLTQALAALRMTALRGKLPVWLSDAMIISSKKSAAAFGRGLD